MGAEELDGGFEALAGVPEIGPKVSFFFEARADGFDIKTFWLESGAEFARLHGRGNRSFGKGTNRVGGGEGATFRVLRDVDQDAAGWAFCDDAFAGDEIRVLGGDAAGDDFRESTELLVGVSGLDGNKDVESGRAGSF